MFKRQSNGWKAILTLSVGISNASSSLLALVHHFKCISNPAPGHTSKVRWQLLCPGPGWFNNWQTPLAVFSYHLAVKHLTAIWKMNEAKEVSYWCGQCAMTCLLHKLLYCYVKRWFSSEMFMTFSSAEKGKSMLLLPKYCKSDPYRNCCRCRHYFRVRIHNILKHCDGKKKHFQNNFILCNSRDKMRVR